MIENDEEEREVLTNIIVFIDNRLEDLKQKIGALNHDAVKEGWIDHVKKEIHEDLVVIFTNLNDALKELGYEKTN